METTVQGAGESRRGRWFVLAVLAVGTVALLVTLVDLAGQKAGPAVVRVSGIDDAQRVFGGVRQDGDRLGSPDAPVTIEMFNDVQCANCREQFLSTVPGLVEGYVRSGDVQLVYRHYSFSTQAVEEGFLAAEAAGEQGYQWQYVYLLFRNQAEAERVGVTERLLTSIAGSIGELDTQQWKRDFNEGGGPDGAITRRLEAQDETARGLGLRAQPSAIVTGPRGTRTLQDSPTLAEIEAAIRAVQ
ncbi:MAG: thioredoxin domain-containing protein [Solirubrobacterales bacterium]